jgi:hypothetical protein
VIASYYARAGLEAFERQEGRPAVLADHEGVTDYARTIYRADAPYFPFAWVEDAVAKLMWQEADAAAEVPPVPLPVPAECRRPALKEAA